MSKRKWTKAQREAQSKRLRKVWNKKEGAAPMTIGYYCPHCNKQLKTVVEVSPCSVEGLKAIH